MEKSESFTKAMELLSVGGNLNRALSDILAWAELKALDGCDPGIPKGLWANAETAVNDWRKSLGL